MYQYRGGTGIPTDASVSNAWAEASFDQLAHPTTSFIVFVIFLCFRKGRAISFLWPLVESVLLSLWLHQQKLGIVWPLAFG